MKNHGGLHNRLTRQIYLEPFTLHECEQFAAINNLGMSRRNVLETYMVLYQLIDNFTLFYFKFMVNGNINEKDFWSRTISKPIYNAWSGLAFERVCFQHIDQIKRALGISGIISNVYSWVYIPKDTEEKGAQIDMLIDRDDNIINVCEMKFSQGEYELTEKYDLELRNKVGTFQSKTKTRKGVSLVMITSYGLKRNAWSNGIQSQITMDDLFQA